MNKISDNLIIGTALETTDITGVVAFTKYLPLKGDSGCFVVELGQWNLEFAQIYIGVVRAKNDAGLDSEATPRLVTLTPNEPPTGKKMYVNVGPEDISETHRFVALKLHCPEEVGVHQVTTSYVFDNIRKVFADVDPDILGVLA